MGEGEIVLSNVFVVVDDIGFSLRPVEGKVIGSGGPSGKIHIHKVGRAAHHTTRRASPVQHHDTPAL